MTTPESSYSLPINPSPLHKPILPHVSTSSAISSKGSKIQSKIYQWMRNTMPGSFTRPTPPGTQTIQDGVRIINSTSSVSHEVGSTLTTNIVALNHLQSIRIVAGLSMINNAYAVYVSAKTLKAEGDWDPALELAGNLGSLSNDISTTLASLKPIIIHFSETAAKQAGAAATAAAPLLSGVGIVLSLAAVASNSKGIHESRNLLQRLKIEVAAEHSDTAKPIKNYLQMLNHLFHLDKPDESLAVKADNKRLKKHFTKDTKTLQNQIASINKAATKALASTHASHRKHVEKLLKTTTATLKGRVKARIASHSVAIAAIIANIIGLIILIVCPPVGLPLMIAFGFMAFSGILSIGKIGYDQYTSKDFLKKMSLHEQEAQELELHMNESETLAPDAKIETPLLQTERSDNNEASKYEEETPMRLKRARASFDALLSAVQSNQNG